MIAYIQQYIYDYDNENCDAFVCLPTFNDCYTCNKCINSCFNSIYKPNRFVHRFFSSSSFFSSLFSLYSSRCIFIQTWFLDDDSPLFKLLRPRAICLYFSKVPSAFELPCHAHPPIGVGAVRLYFGNSRAFRFFHSA